MKIKPNLSSLSFKSEDYEVFHVRPNDYRCDLLLLASNENKSKELLIPVDKCVLEENIPYFKNMLSKDSNWFETKVIANHLSQTLIKHNEILVPTIKMHLDKPAVLGKVIKGIYDKDLEITKENCIDMYHMIDYLSVECCLEDVEKFVKENLTFENTIDLMMLMGDRLDSEIEDFYKNNELTDYDSFIDRLNEANPDVFLSVIHLIHDKLTPAMNCRILREWFRNNPKSLIEDIIPEIKYIFRDLPNFVHKEKFKFYNFCMQKIKPNSDYVYKMFGDIFGTKEENKLSENIEETTVHELIENPIDTFKKLCYDKNPLNDKKNAGLIKLLAGEDEIKKIIEHGTDCKIHQLELVEACHNGQLDIVKVLIECNADINAREVGGIFNDTKCRKPSNLKRTCSNDGKIHRVRMTDAEISMDL